jgi:hypothetical protein
MSKQLPQRPALGRRERWLAVATAVVVLEGGAMKLGIAPPAEHVSILLAAIIAFVGADTIRPSGVTRDASASAGE